VREAHPAIRNPEAYFRAWRVAKFGGDFDPIRVAVDEAVAAFSVGKGEKGRASDRAFARAVLNGRTWRDMGCPERTFYWRLKKLEDFFSPINKG